MIKSISGYCVRFAVFLLLFNNIKEEGRLITWSQVHLEEVSRV